MLSGTLVVRASAPPLVRLLVRRPPEVVVVAVVGSAESESMSETTKNIQGSVEVMRKVRETGNTHLNGQQRPGRGRRTRSQSRHEALEGLYVQGDSLFGLVWICTV